MDTLDIAVPFRWMRRTLALALILLIGAFAAGSFNVYPIADTLLALGSINAAAGLVLLIRYAVTALPYPSATRDRGMLV